MNKVFLIGRLSRDPELRHTTSGTAVCQINVAISRPVAQGSEPQTDFINVTIWNKQAENLVKYQSKGSKISIIGTLGVDKYQAGDKIRYKTYVRVNEIEFLGSKPKETQYSQIKATTRMNEDYNPELAIQSSDLPF